jgi:hypothetical protein
METLPSSFGCSIQRIQKGGPTLVLEEVVEDFGMHFLGCRKH